MYVQRAYHGLRKGLNKRAAAGLWRTLGIKGLRSLGNRPSSYSKVIQQSKQEL